MHVVVVGARLNPPLYVAYWDAVWLKTIASVFKQKKNQIDIKYGTKMELREVEGVCDLWIGT